MNTGPSSPVGAPARKPVIALVGRPNVGKSTLFNKLTRTQDALVADLPGLTRDRQYGDGKVGGWPYLLVDTGGLSGAPETLDAAMADQTLAAIREADVVVFLVDGCDGLMPVDSDIAMVLRREARQVVLCVNKIDGIGEDRAQLEFHALGFEHVVPTAASHSRGIAHLADTLADLLDIDASLRVETGGRRSRKQIREEAAAAAADEGPRGKQSVHRLSREVHIAFVGRPNVGKSTLINRLLGDDRMIAYDQPGTTRDAVAIPFTRASREYTLIDTAGVRRRGKVSEQVEIFSIIKTLQAIDQSNVCVMLLDAVDGVTDQDLSLLGYIIEKGRALVVAVNKWDSLDTAAREKLRESLERRVEFLKFTRIHFISALQGSGVGDVFKSINKAHASAFVDLPTPKLTRLLEVCVEQHQPPMVNGRRIKLRYAHQGGQNPPVIVIHGKQINKVPASYQRYLSNYFLKQLHLFGTPLRLEFRQGDNPFAEKRSTRGDKAFKSGKRGAGKQGTGKNRKQSSMPVQKSSSRRVTEARGKAVSAVRGEAGSKARGPAGSTARAAAGKRVPGTRGRDQ